MLLMEEIYYDLDKMKVRDNFNASQRVRNHTCIFEKVAKEFRKESMKYFEEKRLRKKQRSVK